MAIQFCCSQCGQPIEVDDQHAGQTAACPYCRHVVTVPPASTYEPEASVTARPAAAGAWQPPVPGANAGLATGPDMAAHPRPPGPALTDRQRAAATYGNYALVCAGLVGALFLGVIGYSMVFGLHAASRTPNRIQSFEQMAREFQNSPGAGWVAGGECGLVFFALLGTVLAIVSLSQSRTANWRGWTAVVVCGGALLCFCGIFLLGAALFALGGVPAS
jgi:DNA-directed RNA polymerase subunit RPC12/RpoP